MRTNLLTKILRVAAVLMVISLIAAFAPIGGTPSAEAALPVWPATLIYNIYATDGYLTLADGQVIYVYGYIGGMQGVPMSYLITDPLTGLATIDSLTYALGAPAPTPGPVAAGELALAGHAQVPGPLIYARVGDIVQINFKNLGVTNVNAPNDPHTIHLHGLDVNQANDGVPVTSIAAIAANSLSPGAGNVIVYTFTPTVQGTYMYHCHQEADIHVQMGMYGALVVYGRRDLQAGVGPNALLGGGTQMGFKYTQDTIMLLTEVDVAQHVSEEFALNPAGAPLTGPGAGPLGYTIPFNPVDFHPQYWLINGLSFPNTVHAATLTGVAGTTWANWLLAHPGYDPLISGSVLARSKPLVRMINLGFEIQPMHIHGFHPKLIGMDQRAWNWSNPANARTGTGLELNTFAIASGNTMELLIDIASQLPTSTYPLGTYTKYTVATNAPALNTAVVTPGVLDVIPDLFTNPLGTTPFVGGPAVAGLPAIGLFSVPPALPLTSPQVFVWHNHDDYKATNNGVYPGGQFTAVLVNP